MDKYLRAKRKTIDDDLDDSFDIFLPSKIKEKSVLCQNDEKSCNSNDRKRKSSPSSSLSSFSQETYDSDMDRVMSICLSKNEVSTVSNVKVKERTDNWKELTSKMKPRHPLLLKRTAAEREAILSQKLALILINENKQLNCDSFSLIDMEDVIQSNLLLEQWSKTCRLWSAARNPSEILTEFYIRTFINYVEFDINEKSKMYPTQTSGIIENSLEKSEDSCDEEPGFPLTQNIIVNENSSVDIFENCCAEELLDIDVQSSENISTAKVDDSHFDQHQIDNRLNNEILPVNNEEPKVVAESPDIIILSSPASSSSVHNVPLPTNYSDSQKTVSPAHSFSSVNTEQWNSKVGMLDRIGLTLLSDNWNNLFNTNTGDVTVLLSNEETLNVHKVVISVRCLSLINEITDDNKLMWTMYSLDEGKAFFRYLYAGKCDHLWNLTSFEKNSIKRLARIYHLSHLEEVLNKFHSCHNEANYPDLELKTILEKCDKIKSNSFDRLSVNSTENYGLFISRSPESSSYVNKTSKEYGISLDNKKSENEDKLNCSYKEMQCSENAARERIEISSGSDKGDVNRYDCNFPSPSPPLQDRQSLQDVGCSRNSPVFVRKSLEAFFQDSFPEIPSDGSTSFTTYPIQSAGNISNQNIENHNILSSDSSSDNESDKLSFQASFISSSISESSDRSPRSSPIAHKISYSQPSTSTATSLNKTSLLLNTPSTSSSEIIFSKNVTPFPNYDQMITPQLKKELKKFGLKSDLRSTKAKLILKYIYDQTHPVIESSNLLGKEVTKEHQLTNDSDKTGTLEEMITKLVKSNEELYNHILQFKPIWLEQFYNLLKENGIRCSINDVKDILNKLCITYRANNNTRNTSKKTVRKKCRKKIPAAVLL